MLLLLFLFLFFVVGSVGGRGRYYLIYIGMHLLTLVPAVYKAQMLGFVPYKSSHWMSILLSAQVPVEAQADVLSAI